MSAWQTDTVAGPAAWASYFINGDASSLTSEEIAQADAWRALACGDDGDIVSCDGEPYFSKSTIAWRTTPYRAGDVVDYAILYRVKDPE